MSTAADAGPFSHARAVTGDRAADLPCVSLFETFFVCVWNKALAITVIHEL